MPDEKSAEESAEESESSSDSTESSTDEGVKASEKTSKEDRIPKDRFNEVIEQRNSLREKYELLENQYAKGQNDLSQMLDLLQSREQDSALITRIRELGSAGSEAEKELINKLDLILQGKSEELEELDKEKEKEGSDTAAIEKKTQKLIKQTKEELSETAADQQAELLLMKADMLAEKYFDALPEQYTDKDKQVISTLLTDAVNWETIEGDPNSLSEEVAKAFESVLDFFGSPRGEDSEKAKEDETTEGETSSTEEEKEKSPEYLTKDWGELKEVKLPSGKSLLKPVQSDEDFQKALASILRENRR